MILKKLNFQYFGILFFVMVFICSGCLNKPIESTPLPSPTSLPNPKITSISPSSGPSGTKITLIGLGFGTVQGISQLIFKRGDDKTFESEIMSWSDLNIHARVPQLMEDTYKVFVIVNGIQSNQMEYKLKSTSVLTTCTQCGR